MLNPFFTIPSYYDAFLLCFFKSETGSSEREHTGMDYDRSQNVCILIKQTESLTASVTVIFLYARQGQFYTHYFFSGSKTKHILVSFSYINNSYCRRKSYIHIQFRICYYLSQWLKETVKKNTFIHIYLEGVQPRSEHKYLVMRSVCFRLSVV